MSIDASDPSIKTPGHIVVQVVTPYVVGHSLQAVAMGVLLTQYWSIQSRRQISCRLQVFLASLMILNLSQCGVDIAVSLHSLPGKLESPY